MQLASIQIFPIKSLDGADVSESGFRADGGLALDREWALFDESGHHVNGKRCVLVHSIRAAYDLSSLTVRLSRDGADEVGPLSLERDVPDLEDWFSAHLELPVRLARDAREGFPDDRKRPGPTLASRASLEAVERWFGWSAGEARRRFRVNLVVDGAPAFWEDGRMDAIRVGEAEIHGRNLCKRCVVPSRDPRTGVAIDQFVSTFLEKRKAELPKWAGRTWFAGQLYRFSINTEVPEASRGKRVRVGDEVA